MPFSATEGEICELIGEEGDGAFTDIEADPLDAPQYSFSASIDCLHLIFSDRKGCTGSSSDSLASAAITGLSFCGFGCRGRFHALTSPLIKTEGKRGERWEREAESWRGRGRGGRYEVYSFSSKCHVHLRLRSSAWQSSRSTPPH